jgi:hypothetical protein
MTSAYRRSQEQQQLIWRRQGEGEGEGEEVGGREAEAEGVKASSGTDMPCARARSATYRSLDPARRTIQNRAAERCGGDNANAAHRSSEGDASRVSAAEVRQPSAVVRSKGGFGLDGERLRVDRRQTTASQAR